MQLTLHFTALFRRIAPYTREIRLAKIHFFPKKRPVFRRPAEAPLAETVDSWTLVPRYSVASAPYDRTTKEKNPFSLRADFFSYLKK